MGRINGGAIPFHRLADGLGHGDLPVRRDSASTRNAGVFVSADGTGVAGGGEEAKKVRAPRFLRLLLNIADDADAIVHEILHHVEEIMSG